MEKQKILRIYEAHDQRHKGYIKFSECLTALEEFSGMSKLILVVVCVFYLFLQ